MRAHARPLVPALVLALAAPVLVACGEDHTEGVTAATVETPTTASGSAGGTEPSGGAAATTVPGAAALAIARDRSSVGFTAAKVTASHDGTFSDFSGTIQLAPGDDVTASTVEVTIQMGSLAIEPARLASHLRTPDLLDVARFPTATFRSTRIEPAVGVPAATHTVTGELSLHGQTRTITFPAVIAVTPAEVSARAEFSVNRQDFGISYPGMPDDLIRDEVVIRFDVHAPRS